MVNHVKLNTVKLITIIIYILEVIYLKKKIKGKQIMKIKKFLSFTFITEALVFFTISASTLTLENLNDWTQPLETRKIQIYAKKIQISRFSRNIQTYVKNFLMYQ